MKEFALQFFSHIGKKSLDALFPPVCLHCLRIISEQKKFLCDDCQELIHINVSPYCPDCFSRRPDFSRCHSSPHLLFPASFYQGPVPALVHAFKYRRLIRLELFLAALCVVHLEKTGFDVRNFYFTFIPLHSSKQRQRGFNQSQAISQIIASYFSRPLVTTLKREMGSYSQTAAEGYAQRTRNIKGVFTPLDSAIIARKNFVIVDDISTSGATLHESSRVLKSAGAGKIIALVVAKA